MEEGFIMQKWMFCEQIFSSETDQISKITSPQAQGKSCEKSLLFLLLIHEHMLPSLSFSGFSLLSLVGGIFRVIVWAPELLSFQGTIVVSMLVNGTSEEV